MASYLTSEHRKTLLDSAISAEVLDASGIRSTPTALEFPWSDGTGPVIWQSRPDQPRGDAKYLFPRGAKVGFNRLRDQDDTSPLAIIEGTKQGWAGLSYLPAHMAVYAMAGCHGYTHADLSVSEGREIFLMLDADCSTNPAVYAAAEALTKKLKLHGAKSVSYVETTGEASDGLDDVLAALPEGKRASMLRTWLAAAPTKLPKRPKPKRPAATDAEAEAIKLFKTRDKPMHYQPLKGAQDILERHPAAITVERTISLYKGGVYSVDPDGVMHAVARKLGDLYSPSFVKSTTDLLKMVLTDAGMVLPERMPEPLLNAANGMVDLRTGEVLKHDPKYLSYVQSPIPYDADMSTPVYDSWLREAVRPIGGSDEDADLIMAGLEEVAGTMLDPTRTPSKTLFLFGASRTGKSTFLRLLKAIAGAANTSALTLHQLTEDKFMPAGLFGKALNVAADLSNKHVNDLSVFKMVTGEDPIEAQRKNGHPFTFTNQALIAFSANELPTVSESSHAYAERTWPVGFPNSFAGREDKTLEPKLMAELPGILARWVKAYGRFLARGGYAVQDAATRTEFEAKSDRVHQFFIDMCTVTEARYGQTLADDECTGRRDASIAFGAWAERNGGSKMGERAFFQRFAQIDGVTEVKRANRARAYNVTIAREDDDSWSDIDEPQLDAIEPSGVIAEALAANPWNAAEVCMDTFPSSVAHETVSEPQVDTQPVWHVNGDDVSAPSFLDFNENLFD